MRLTRCAFLGLLFTLTLSFGVRAQSLDPNAKLPFDPKVRTGKLPNGLTYYIRKNGKPEHRAELRLAVRTGSVMEDDDQQGLAHFIEHMAFNGTKRYPHNTLESFLEGHGARFGADLNAYTSFDETVYKQSLPTDQGTVLDSGLDILAEWAHNLSFDSSEIEKERGVVGEEWRLGRGAEERVWMKEVPTVFYGSKYAQRNVIGEKAILDTAHQDRLIQFYRDWYRPDLMAVIAVGDFDPDKVERQIKELFSPLQNPSNERARDQHPLPPHSETLVTINSDKEYPYTNFSMMFKRPAKDEVTVGDYRHDLLIGLYNQMLNARIQEMLQRGTAPFSFGSAGDGRFIGDVRSYSAYAMLRQDSIKEGITSLLREIYRAQKTGFSASELDRAKKTYLSALEKQWQEKEKTKNTDYVNEYVRNFLHNEPAPGIDYEYEAAKQLAPSIKISEVNALSPELLGHASRVLTFAAPESVTLPTKEELLKIVSSVEQEKLTAYEDKTSNAPLLKNAPKAGKVVSEKKLTEIGVTEWQLSNGARVVLKPTDFKDNEVLFYATAPGGSSIASDADYVSAENGDNVVEESGLADFDSPTLTKMLAGKELEITPYVTTIQEGLQGHSTKKDLETLLQLANLYMTAPRYDSVAASSYFSRIKSFLDNRAKQPESHFSDTLAVTLAQNHRRARPFTSDLIKEIDLHKAYDFYRSLYNDAGNFTFYFVGNVDPATLKPFAERYLASLPSSKQHAQFRDVGIRAPKGVIVKQVMKGTEPKSVVEIDFTGTGKFSRAERFRLSTMAQAFAIKLREDLREDKSGVYYVRVSPTFNKYPYENYKLAINFGCNPDRVNELVTEVMKQLDTLTTQPIAATYVDRVKKIMSNELETNLKENNYWMMQLRDAYWNDLDPSAIMHTKEMIDAITPNDVLQTAKQYFDRQNYVEVVLLPEHKS
jgi:zinc protease